MCLEQVGEQRARLVVGHAGDGDDFGEGEAAVLDEQGQGEALVEVEAVNEVGVDGLEGLDAETLAALGGETGQTSA